MDEEYSYEIQRGRAFDEDPDFNDNYADQGVAVMLERITNCPCAAKILEGNTG